MEMSSSDYSLYVYRTVSGMNVNATLCAALCALDFERDDDAPCHFYVPDPGVCYLGSLSRAITGASAVYPSSDFVFKNGTFESYLISLNS